MSGHTDASHLSRRWPESPEETVAAGEPAEEEVVSEATLPPVDVKSTLNYRLMLGGVIFLGVLIVAGITLLIVGLAKGWNHPKPAPADALAGFHKPVDMTLQSGYRILSSDTQPGRLILHIRSETSDEIWIIDTNDGHIVAVVHGEAPKQ